MTLYFANSDVVAGHNELSDRSIRANDLQDDLFGPRSGVKWFDLSDSGGNVWTVAQS